MTSFRQRSTLALLAEENDALARRIDPSGFCHAVLQVLRLGEHYSEADFQALVRQGAEPVALLPQVPQPEPAHRVDREREREREEPAPRRQRPRRPPRVNGQVRYAGSDEEDERVREAERIGAAVGLEEVYDDDRDDDEGEGEEWEDPEAPRRSPRSERVARPPRPQESTLTLTGPQLQALLAEASKQAMLEALAQQAPTVARPAPGSGPEPGADEEAEEAEEAEDTVFEADPEAPAEADVQDDQEDQDDADRERDSAGRFVPSPARGKR